LIEPTSESIRVDLQKFKTGQTCRRRRRRRRKNSKLKVNNGRTPTSLHHLDVLDETNRLSLAASQSELIWKCLNGVSSGGGGREGGVEQ